MISSSLINSNVFASTEGSTDKKTIYVTTTSDWLTWGEPSITLRQEQVDVVPADGWLNPFTRECERKMISIYPSYYITIKNLTTGETESKGLLGLGSRKCWEDGKEKISLKDDCEYAITVEYDNKKTGFGYTISNKFINGTYPHWYVANSNKALYR